MTTFLQTPTLKGIIDRRILINYTANPAIVSNLLPAPFRPKIYKGKAVVGICLIRLKQIRPKGLPAFVGLSSENGAHRIAVEWDEDGKTKSGVYIPRRDTSSPINAWVGGRVFPGKHYLAKFDVHEANGKYHIGFSSEDETSLNIKVEEADQLNPDSIFGNLSKASQFFEEGSVGYCPCEGNFDGLLLKVDQWKVKPLKITEVQSSFFDDPTNFPTGSIQFDNALLMTHIPHEWHSIGSIKGH